MVNKVMAVEAEEDGKSASFEHLPEVCIANVLSFTTPRDVCALSLVSSTFRSAAQSDVVWERFLPSDSEYRAAILSHSPSPLASKKDLYLHLCQNPLLVDAAKMSLALDKPYGKKCYMLSPRILSIVWGDTPSYWKWTSTPDSRFDEVAELRSVCWLEIRGRMKTCMLSPDTLYGAYLVFRLWVNSYGFLHQPVEVSVGIVGEGEPRRRTVYLDTSKPGMTPFHRVVARRYRVPHRMITRPRFRVCDGYFEEHAAHVDVSRVGIDCPKERGDGWWEIELGDFFNGGGGGDDCEREVEMGVYEVTGGDWKGGLVLQGIELRPKHKS